MRPRGYPWILALLALAGGWPSSVPAQGGAGGHGSADAGAVDSLRAMPLADAAGVRAYLTLRSGLRARGIDPPVAEDRRLYRACDSLDLPAERARAAYAFLQTYIRRRGTEAEVFIYAEDLARGIDLLDARLRSDAYNYLGNARAEVGDYSGAIAFYLQAYEAADPGTARGLIHALGNLGDTYAEAGDTAAARRTLHRSRRTAARLASPLLRAYSDGYDYVSLATLMGPGEVDSADYYFAAARPLAAVLSGNEGWWRELRLQYLASVIPHELRLGRYASAALHLDTLAAVAPGEVPLLRAAYLEAAASPRAAFDYLRAVELDGEDHERERRRALARLADGLGEYAVGYGQLRETLARGEREIAQLRGALVDVSERMLGSFEGERVATARRHASELAAYRSRQRLFLLAVGLLAAVAIAAWALYRYRASRRRSADLSALVSTQERDLARANVELRARVRAAERYNHLLSHDLREPVRSIAGFTQLLARDIPGGAAAEHLAYLQSGVAQLTDLLSGVERLRRIEEHAPTAREVDVAAAVGEAVRATRERYPWVAADVTHAATLPRVRTDPTLVAVVAAELTENAFKFRRERGGRVAVEVAVAGGACTLRVEDDGIGVSPEYRAQVFEAFKRINRREEFAGTGVGLALVAIAARKLEASVELSGGLLGRGTCVEVVIPVAVAVPAEAPIVEETPVPAEVFANGNSRGGENSRA